MNDYEEPRVPKRVASTISFPYSDISDAIFIADGLLKGGGLAMSRDQLGAATSLAPTGGTFALRVSTAKLFGTIETQAGKYQLTKLGHEIVDPVRRSEALAEAFLQVELYKRVYDEFRGKRLPPRPAGLEAAFVNFGVSPKNVRAARLAFDKSARAAGFFPNGDEDRLVEPLIVPSKFIADNVQTVAERAHEADSIVEPVEPIRVPGSTVASGIHKSIIGMLDELPPPKTEWDKREQADWLEAMATLFQVIYKSKDKGEIKIAFQPPFDL